MQDFRVKTFLTVCRTLNYTRAAEELALTQPAVSQHITYLEREYGAKLFTYHRKKLELTPAGRVLRDGLATMAHDDVLLHERIEEVAHGATVKLRIGMTLTAGEYVVARPLARCLGARPDIQITVRSGGTQHLMELLDAGTIDCAFVEGLFDKARYASRPFSSERLVPICAAEHRFPRTPRTLEDLLGERLILREEGSGSRNVLVHALAQRNLSPASFADHFVVESLDIIKIFVQADLGISFVYEAAVQREVQEGTLRVIPLSDAGIFHDISFIYLRDSIYEQDMENLFAALSACSQADHSKPRQSGKFSSEFDTYHFISAIGISNSVDLLSPTNKIEGLPIYRSPSIGSIMSKTSKSSPRKLRPLYATLGTAPAILATAYSGARSRPV